MFLALEILGGGIVHIFNFFQKMTVTTVLGIQSTEPFYRAGDKPLLHSEKLHVRLWMQRAHMEQAKSKVQRIIIDPSGVNPKHPPHGPIQMDTILTRNMEPS